MYHKTFLLIILLLFAAMTGKASGAPVFGKIYDLIQPDRTTVAVRIWGDEYYQEVESLNGYTLIRDPNTQDICYAYLSEDGSELLSTGISASESFYGAIILRILR